MSAASALMDNLLRDFDDDEAIDRMPSPEEMRRRAGVCASAGLALLDDGNDDEAAEAIAYGERLMAWAATQEARVA